MVASLMAAWLFPSALQPQTTQGLISGRISHSVTGAVLAHAWIHYRNLSTRVEGDGYSDPQGFYVLPLLSPGAYYIKVSLTGFRSEEVYNLELRVAAFLELNFRLRPRSDLWEASQFRSVFSPSGNLLNSDGPDLDMSHTRTIQPPRPTGGRLESSISDVIDPAAVQDLPLWGRDIYATLVLQPGVTADTTTARGLGLSVGGQRPTSSNFLLDGLENNNYLTTGPLLTLPPEAVQEYRISTNNYSAEFGRTAGFLANVVTRSGEDRWHATAYFDLKNDVLNANDYQRNAHQLGYPAPLSEDRDGLQITGPLWKKRLFSSTLFEHLRSRGAGDQESFQVPGAQLLSNLQIGYAQEQGVNVFNSLRLWPAVIGAEGPSQQDGTEPVRNLTPPVSVDSLLGIQKLDYASESGRQHAMLRVSGSNYGRPDFVWSPYQGFSTELNRSIRNLATSHTWTLREDLVNEARFSVGTNLLEIDRPHPEVPRMVIENSNLVLPGALVDYGLRHRERTIELDDNLVVTKEAHTVKVGGGYFQHGISGDRSLLQDGFYVFGSLGALEQARPDHYWIEISRQPTPQQLVSPPDYASSFADKQFFLFAQDSFKVNRRLVLNYGLRYENFGSPRTGDVGSAVVGLGSGASLAERLRGSHLDFLTGGQKLYAADRKNLGARAAFSFVPARNTVVRGGYGVFFDRPFDNLWLNIRSNNVQSAVGDFDGTSQPYLFPLRAAIGAGAVPAPSAYSLDPLTLIDPGLRPATVKSAFVSVQQAAGSNLQLEANAIYSRGEDLIATDIVNRMLSLPFGKPPMLSQTRLNAQLPDINYRGNQGKSLYRALTVSARYRSRAGQLHLAYTLSRAMDNQSEPLAGDFDANAATTGISADGRAAFTRQFAPGVDWGRADFNQTHNVVFYSIWYLPAPKWGQRTRRLLTGWQVSQLAAIRSGLPFTVYSYGVSLTGETLINNRADLTSPGAAMVRNQQPDGTLVLLNRNAFAAPSLGTLGNSLRNEFTGPGLVNFDVSLGRSFSIPLLRETARFTVRADVFNFLNHANLNNPDHVLGDPNFGQALFGRQDTASTFPSLTPLNETGRQVQIILKLQF
jgi:Carboxypeptidase regulatory-like domain